MKVHGFNNSVPPINEGNKKHIDGNETSVENLKKRNIPLQSDLKAKARSERTSLSVVILNGNDRIEIAFDSTTEIEIQNKAQNAVYKLESVRGNNNDSIATEKSSKLANIRQKAADGYYDSPEFIDKLAEKLITIFKISGE